MSYYATTSTLYYYLLFYYKNKYFDVTFIKIMYPEINITFIKLFHILLIINKNNLSKLLFFLIFLYFFNIRKSVYYLW